MNYHHEMIAFPIRSCHLLRLICREYPSQFAFLPTVSQKEKERREPRNVSTASSSFVCEPHQTKNVRVSDRLAVAAVEQENESGVCHKPGTCYSQKISTDTAVFRLNSTRTLHANRPRLARPIKLCMPIGKPTQRFASACSVH